MTSVQSEEEFLTFAKTLAFFREELQISNASDTEITNNVELCDLIIWLAIERGASHVHIEATKIEGQLCVLVRYWIDGVVYVIHRMPLSLDELVNTQFKILFGVNVGEQNVPQSGQISLKYGDKAFELRLHTLPQIYGERLAIRIIDRSSSFIGLEKLGLFPDDLSRLHTVLRQPQGLVLVTGSSGTGRTTTIYSCLEQFSGIARKVFTTEDPLDVLLPFVTQCAVRNREDLRSCLHQEPDAILVSELRDLEITQISIEAALTGHLVFSTFLATQVASAILTLMRNGIAPDLLATSLVAIIAQRLVRRICPECREPIDASLLHSYERVRELASAGGYEFPTEAIFYYGRGCENCRGRGYRGRIGLFEIVETNEAIAGAILRDAGYEELTRLARKSGARNLWADGLRKVVAGETTLDEVRRVVFAPGL